jgi:uncharacterized protein (DUF1810 family)
MDRFLTVQENVYEKALAEIVKGNKRTHWMWFIFPQFRELGKVRCLFFMELKTLRRRKSILRIPY